ncbi:S26 family signal peptidase [Novosphingobium sp. 9U]|uniref:S26 family signal peptidase n=1 Tax=Novosphingobium sp. 9U TaxID=2653158 RepID=UPI0012F095ED|nr:S26 family signal peptidase [Novosphingobium sp. 9U]VWX49841.1 Conjugative signal peptidase TrhF [Novosphingobium sp. 9U]
MVLATNAVATVGAGVRPSRRLSARSKLLGLALVAAIGLGFQSLRHWHDTHAIMINASESLPNWAFLVETGRFPARGEYVAFTPGKDPLTVKHFGSPPEPFIKRAYGLPGDVVSHRGADVLVNGTPVARMKPLTRQGEVLRPGPVGVVPRDCIFAATPHKDGFDSRYAAIGFVCKRQLVGVGVSIL